MTAQVAHVGTQSLKALLARNPTLASVAAHLDALPVEERIRQVRELSSGDLRGLWQLASAAAPLAVTDIVPTSAPAFRVVAWAGKNSLPAFSSFEKHMYRDEQGRIFGQNVQTFAPLTGPGYFLVVSHPEPPGEVLFDYTVLPDAAPHGWPRITSNSKGISFFVYRNLKDAMRRVSDGVVIGMAMRNTRPLGQYFALVLKER